MNSVRPAAITASMLSVYSGTSGGLRKKTPAKRGRKTSYDFELLRISPPTIDRILEQVRAEYANHGRRTTKPGTLLKRHISVKMNQWDESRPWFLEADTVAHCGSTVDSAFVNTIDCVDIATGWIEQYAVWGEKTARMSSVRSRISSSPCRSRSGVLMSTTAVSS